MSNKEKKDAAMDQLFGGLTMPSSPSSPSDMPQESSQTLSPRQKKYQEENERITTIVNTEDMNKARFIAAKEGIAIREVIGAGIKLAIKAYESDHGPIHTRKTKGKRGDASKVFNV